MFLLLIAAVSWGLCLALTPFVKILATRHGLVDRPDGRRKIHARPIPLAGGIAILLAILGALALTLLGSDHLLESFQQERFRIFGLLLAAVAICAIGVADDFRCLRGKHKLFGQILAALLLIQFNWVVRSISFFDWHIDLGILAVPFTLLWLLGAINSLNLIDGMDGMLGIIGLILCAALAGFAAFEQRWPAACVAAALAGALIGFLHFNFPPASVFLGDAGSMLIGLVVGALAIHGGVQEPATVSLIIPLALLTLPIFDSAAAIIRRKLTGRSIYSTDRAHLHHCLLRQGYSPRRVLLAVACVCSVCALGGMVGSVLEQELIAVFCSLTVLTFLISSGTFGGAEFMLLRNRFTDLLLTFLRISARSEGRAMVIRLQGTVDWEELWINLLAGCKHLNLVMVRLDVNAPALHEGYHARWDGTHADHVDAALWRTEIPLMMDNQVLGRVEVAGLQDQEPIRDKIEMLLKLVDYFETEAADLIGVKALAPALAPVHAPPSEKVEKVENMENVSHPV